MQRINIVDEIKYNARDYLDHVAVIDGDEEYRYDQLLESVENRTQALMQHGVKAGDAVGVLGHNGFDFISYMLALMNLDAVTFPISSQLTETEIKQLIDRTSLQWICYDPTATDYQQMPVGDLDADWVLTNGHEQTLTALERVPGAAFVRFTSGTTGLAKGVILSHQSIIERTHSANELLKLSTDDVVIWVLSMAYHFVVSILLYLRYGCTVVVVPGFMAEDILTATNTHDGTLLYVSPMHVKLLNRFKDGRMSTMKRVVSTSMAISEVSCQSFYEKYNIPITQAYGIIEVGLPVMNTKSPDQAPGAIGHALPSYEVGVFDKAGQVVSPNQIGHLRMRGPGMFDAYLDPYMSQEETLIQGYFDTGDLATMDESGLITIKGRVKNVINVSGNKAFPEEIEHVLRTYPGVIDCRVQGYAHPLLIEGVMAEVVTDVEDLDIEAVIRHCRKQLTTYKVPSRIKIVDELPMTDSGKIKRSVD